MKLIDADKLIEELNKNSIFRTVTNAEGKSAIEIIKEQPTYKTDGYVNQIRWERDVAISQLEKLGIGFGQKIEDEMIKAVKEVIGCV